MLLCLVALTPWPFGSVTTAWRLVVSLGILSLLILWASHAIVTRRLAYLPDPVSNCLLGLVLLTVVQLIPLPEPLVRVLSPHAAERWATLLPATEELLPGESETVKRSWWVRLSAAEAETEDLLSGLLAAFLTYAVARNFAISRSDPGESLRRLAWVAFSLGVALSVLGFAQALSSGRSRIYWWLETQNACFGPFVNKNHFAFQVNLFMGLGGGLFATVARRPHGWRTPTGLGLLGGLGVMMAAVAFSESRGGLLAALAAAVFVGLVARFGGGGGVAEPGAPRVGLILGGGVTLVAGALVAWLGLHDVVERTATLWGGNAGTRAATWRSVWPLVGQHPLTGVGGGGVLWMEPTVRTRSDLKLQFDVIDNDYLQMLIEGGVFGFALAIGLACSAIWLSIRGYRRTGDPLLLGCTFGLTAVAVHSAGDFGLHIASVAVAAAAVAAHAAVRSRTAEERGEDTREWAVTGRGVYVGVALMLLAGLALVLAHWRTHRATTHRETARALLNLAPERWPAAIRSLEAATEIRPNDSEAWDLLMSGHLSLAAEKQKTATAAVVGGFAFGPGGELNVHGDPGGHVTAALRAARGARASQSLNSAAHLTLGAFADRFTHGEPAPVHFARAKAITAFDPDVWYASGRSAADRGDWAAAVADWRESLRRSPKRLRPIVVRAATHMPPEAIRSQLLADDPAAWLAATPFVFASSVNPNRTPWLRAVADRWAAGPEPTELAGFAGWAGALEELGDWTAAGRVWGRAAELFPDSPQPRDRMAARLESLEQYEEAVPLLEWLAARAPDREEYAERLAAARHALKLKAEINAR